MKAYKIILLMMLGLSHNIMAQQDTVLVETIDEVSQIQAWADKGLAAHKIDDLMGAISWLSKAANKNHAHAQAMLGYIYIRSGEDELALPFLQKAATQQDSMAMYELATLYISGKLLEKNNSKSVALLKQAIAQDYYPAYFSLASAYEGGNLDLAKDFNKALTLYQQASDKGYSTATYRLIRAYKNGELGLTIDREKVKEMKTAMDVLAKENAKEKAEKLLAIEQENSEK